MRRLRKPFQDEHAVGVYRMCLQRVRSRRLKSKGVTLLSKEQLETFPGKDHLGKNHLVEGEGILDKLEKAIASLSPREQRVIRLRYFPEHGKPAPYETIGRQECVSGERIRQLDRRLLVRLRMLLEQN